MNIRNLLWENAKADTQRALPILSFPAVQRMGKTVTELVNAPELMAKAMQIVAS